MSTDRRFRKEIDQIESIAETKGIELDDIDVRETTTDDGDELIVFRILETKAETEEDSVGVQVSKMPSVQTGDMAFRNEVQNKLKALKRHLAGQQPADEVEAQADDQDSNGEQSDSSPDTGRKTTHTRDYVDDYDGGPGAELDQRLRAVEAQLDDLEERVAELESKSEALDGLQQLMQGDSDE